PHRLEAPERVVRDAPAAHRVEPARERVHHGVEVGRDVEAPDLGVVAGVADDGELVPGARRGEATQELRSARAARERGHAHLRPASLRAASRGRSRRARPRARRSGARHRSPPRTLPRPKRSRPPRARAGPRTRTGHARRRRPAGGDSRSPARPAGPSPKRAREWGHARPRSGKKPRAATLPGSYFFPSTASFRLLVMRNLQTRFAGILRGSPVWGFRPIRALRLARTSLPNPGTTNPFLASLHASASSSSRTSAICFFAIEVFWPRDPRVADFVIILAPRCPR